MILRLLIPLGLALGFLLVPTSARSSCLGPLADLKRAVGSVTGASGEGLLHALETIADEIALTAEIANGVLAALERKIATGKLDFAGRADKLRANAAIATIALREGVDLPRYPEVERWLLRMNDAKEIYRVHLEEIFDAYPAKAVAIPKWKDESRRILREDLARMGIGNDADRVARNLVNKVERQARTADLVADAAPVNQSAMDFIGAGKGGFVVPGVGITDEACESAKYSDVSVRKKLAAWIGSLEKRGMAATREIPGFHDHPLDGPWAGKRSVYLTRKWRAIYVENRDGTLTIIRVSNHDYRIK